jgi:uncharacterized protein
MHIIIDGYNLIRQSDRLRRYERQSLETGRRALIMDLAEYRKIKKHKITVVFDGWKNGEPDEERDRQAGIDIIYSRLGEKADDVIKRIAEKCSDETVVVSSDRDIASYVTRIGQTALSSLDFDNLIYLALTESSTNTFVVNDIDENDRRSSKKKGQARKLSRSQKQILSKIKKL